MNQTPSHSVSQSVPSWLSDISLQQFFAAVRSAGGEARAVGGAVRDFLVGIEGGDVDVASTLPPERVMALAAQLGFKAVPTGIDHGTVTLVLPAQVIEVTTLRRDVETDGRHAKVVFTDRFEEDAARRDFTINALYMDADGHVYDYFDGQKDLAARCVRFIGDASARIQEDGLRILRFFRFFARFGEGAPDAKALAACADHKTMIAQLSGERIAMEMKKLLASAAPAVALEQMARVGIMSLLTGMEWNNGALKTLLQLEAACGTVADPWARLAAGGAAAGFVPERWKLSRADSYALGLLLMPVAMLSTSVVKEWLRRLPRELVVSRILVAASQESNDALALQLVTLAQTWDVPEFPLTAADLLARGFAQGKALGDALRMLEEAWAHSDYHLGKTELLALLP